ncbi:MAG: ATPase domain-containing protein [Candidatus Micrarchaeaceae archaeon]
MKRVKYGIEGLDKMMDGGLIPGRVYFLSGGTGTGKTVLGLRFLWEGLRNGEKCMYIAVDRPPSVFLPNVTRSFKWSLNNMSLMDAVPAHSLYTVGYPVHDITAKGEISKVSKMKEGAEKGELTIESIIMKLTKEFDTNKYDRIVLDSLTILRKYGIEEERKNLAIHQLVRFFIEKKVTTILTVDSNVEDLSAELLLSDGFIILNKEVRKNAYYRTLQILKMRGTTFDFKPHELLINEEGVSVRI